MIGIGIVVAQLGYWIAYYGFDLLTGGNDSFLDLGVPGRWKGAAPKDGPASAAGLQQTTPASGPPAGPAATAPGVNDQPGSQFVAPGHIGANGDAPSATPGQVNN